MIVEVENPQCSGVQSENDENTAQTFYQNTVEKLLKGIFPRPIFFSKKDLTETLQKKLSFLNENLPIIKWGIPEKTPAKVSIVLICKKRLNACSFFYDMICRWLLSQQKINIELFFTCDFRLPELSSSSFTASEISFSVKNTSDLNEIKRNYKTLESEIRLGIISDYHANRILEFKGLSNEGKTAMIQEKIHSLIQNHSNGFDRSIFSQMQHFLISCEDEFKKIRDYHHISRIISLLHNTRKLIGQKIDSFRDQRHLIVKFLRTKLHLQTKKKNVLGVMVGLNFLEKHEVFEKTHLVRAIQDFLPNIDLVQHSFFVDRNRENSIQTLYLEIEKNDGKDFSIEEIKLLRKTLPEHLKNYIERLRYPIFMPRNEEEVLRNVTILSKQLKFVNDLPQLIVNFDEQKDKELVFTVILARVLHPKHTPLTTIFQQSKKCSFSLEKVKKVGMIRKRYVKEASVFRAVLKSSSYLRMDYTVDIHQARQDLIEELFSLFGEMRDYNGGMLHKQNEVFQALKQTLGKICFRHELLLEKFFFSIFPAQMRSILSVGYLKSFFLLFLNGMKKNRAYPLRDMLFKQEKSHLCVVYPAKNPLRKKYILTAIENLALSNHKLIQCQFDSFDIPLGGYLFLEEDFEEQRRFLETIQQALDF